MHPELFGVSSYAIALVAAVCGGIGVVGVAGRLHGLPPTRFFLLGVSLAGVMLVGAKLYALAEGPVAQVGFQSVFTEGFRQPGTLLAAFFLPILTRVFLPGYSIRLVADAYIVPAAIGLATFRIGCYLRGCCFGTITLVPWAIRFPSGSPAWAHHESLGFLHGYEDVSLPVHPLQCYFAGAVLVAATVPLLMKRRGILERGEAFLAFVCLSEGSKYFLEFLRAKPRGTVVTVQGADGLAALGVAAFLIVALIWRCWRWSERRKLKWVS